jgi:hypothetical protein
MNIGMRSRQRKNNKYSVNFYILIPSILLFLLFSSAISFQCANTQYQLITTGRELNELVNQNIIIEGKVSNIPWQHLIGYTKNYPYTCYFDFDKSQTVIYSKTPIECRDRIKIRGKIIKISGKSKKPGSDEDYSENHIIADDWECIK